MPPSPRPTPLERLLCWLLSAIIVLILAVFPLALGEDRFFSFANDLFRWAAVRWILILRASLPEFTRPDLIHLLLLSLPIGALVLVPALLAQSVCWGRWWRPATLWFWTALYGLIPVVLGVEYLCRILASYDRLADAPLLHRLMHISETTLGLCIAVLACRAWWYRRRVDRAALAANTPADPALPD